ncbi:MAG: hypothetical protein M3Z75_02210 [Actinomycetota bacterium]|nr:hypothetical protein [Actinomycetota bacterium]
MTGSPLAQDRSLGSDAAGSSSSDVPGWWERPAAGRILRSRIHMTGPSAIFGAPGGSGTSVRKTFTMRL